MTHEQRDEVFDEPFGGPRYDHRLPDAGDIPEYSNVEQSLAPPMVDVSDLDAAPDSDSVPGIWPGEMWPHPRRSGPTENEA